MFGHLFEADHLVGAARGQRGNLPHVRDALGVAGVDQPVADAGRAQKDPRQLGFGELAATLPIVLRLRMFGQAERWRAVGAHGEAKLGVESGVEVGEWLGVGLVEAVLKAMPVPRLQPAAVRMLIDQRHAGDVVRQSRHPHTLQAIRNLSASCSRLRWA